MFKTIKNLLGTGAGKPPALPPSDSGNYGRPLKADGKRKQKDRRKRNDPLPPGVTADRRKGDRRAKQEPVVSHPPAPPVHVTEVAEAVGDFLQQATGTDGVVVPITAVRRNVTASEGGHDSRGAVPAKGLAVVSSPIPSNGAKLSPATVTTGTQPPHQRGGVTVPKKAITTEAELVAEIGQRWRGMLKGVVHDEQSSECIALDVMCGQVVIVVTEEANRSTHFISVKRKIESEWSFKIINTFVLPSQLILEIHSNIMAAADRGQRVFLTKEHCLVRVYDDIVELAIKAGASDIHFETCDGEGLLRLRIGGYLHHWWKLPGDLILDCLSAAFGGRYVDGSGNHPAWGKDISLAFITQQTVGGSLWHGRYDGGNHSTGYYAVMRLLESTVRTEDIKTLGGLGYLESHLNQLALALSRQWGLFLAIGGTGEGKSTLLRSVLVHLPGARNLSIQTIESPVEYKMPGVIQYNVPVDVGKSSEEITQLFVGYLRNAMRRDPDVLMVGEIRDHESAALAIAFAQTDKRCFSTIHAGGGIKSLSRMADQTLAIASDTLGEGNLVNCCVYQKLLPKLCENCRIRADDKDHGLPESKRKVLLERFDLDPKLMWVERPGGCDQCRPTVAGLEITGTVGRVVAAEVFMPTEEMLPLIAARRWAEVTRLWRSTRTANFTSPDMTGKTAFECGLYYVATGVVSLRHFEKKFESIESYIPMDIIPK